MAVKMELLELNPSAESSQPYRLLIAIEDPIQLSDIVRNLNIAAQRTPKTFCLPKLLLRFHMPDGTLQEVSGFCDPNNPTLAGEQDFWKNQEAAAPAQLVALINSHLEGAQSTSPAPDSVNPVALSDLSGV